MTVAATCTFSTVHAVPVGLELALVIDISGSISNAEYNLQRQGYVNAFNDPTVQANILSFAPSGGVAVAVYQFASNATTSIGWTQIDDAADLAAFVTALNGMARSGSIGSFTDISDGMAIARIGLTTNAFEGSRLVMDISGDGEDNQGGLGSVLTERTAAASAGIIINGLPIGGASLTTYYTNNVITTNGFVEPSATFADFNDAILRKIGRETDPDGDLPAPGIAWLLSAGLAAAGLRLRQRRA